MAVLFSKPYVGGSGIQTIRPCRLSPRCIVLTAVISFIAFNLMFFHAGPLQPELGVSSEPGTFQRYKQQYLQRPNITGYTSQQHSPRPAPPWFGDWIRWQAFDPALTYEKLAPLEKRSLDLIYAWVNGSDASLQMLRRHYQNLSPLFAKADSHEVAQVTSKRFRDMDELRYSVRSALQYSADAIRNIHLMVSPVPDSPTADPSSFLVSSQTQSPDWFDAAARQPKMFQLVNHADFFALKEHLPSFNSLAIEANMDNISGLSPNFLYLNDDIFLGRRLNTADFWTPLYGYVLHMEASLRVPPRLREVPESPFDIGEWHSLQFTNVLLSERFGARDRAYVAHIVHLFNKDILDEIHQLWPQEFRDTSSHRFRGEGDGQDIHTSFMFAHYIQERLREVQLEAFWRNTVDYNSDDKLDLRERQWLVDRINEWNDGDQVVFRLYQDHLANHKAILDQFNMTLTGSTDYRISGIDGFPYLLANADTSQSIHAEGVEQVPYTGYEPHSKRQCKIDVQFCLGSNFVDSSIPVLSKSQTMDAFQRIFREEFHCGDCLLEMAMHHRNLGLRSLFPADESSPQYKQLVGDLERYQYVLGTSPYVFIALQSPENTKKNMDEMWASRDHLAFMCINDDYSDDAKTEQSIQHLLQSFLDKRYPFAAPWEKYPPIQVLAPAE
ncbi:Xanthine phosphoribosyltransferase 1 [Actinomortierella ambigua]|nr:Xanthine phosphoribosyltransferase 1 [Actinomortierella ambigua]